MDKDDLIKRVKEDKVSFISYQFTDINGVVKSLDAPVERLQQVLERGIWFDGSSVEGFARVQESDMHLRVDPETYSILPWTSDEFRRGRVLCDIYQQSGEPFDGDPRGVLKRNLQKLREEYGWVLDIGPEPEFYLFLRDGNEQMHPVPYDVGSYFDFSADDAAVRVRTELMSALAQMGLEVEIGHHESGLGQHEIDFRFANALRTADNVQTFKSAVKAIAARNGLIASFMPKPMVDAPGSGMHCHQSISDLNGKNLFYAADDAFKLSDLAYKFLAGQLKHARALSAIVAPTVNSYKRLVPGFEAPVYIGWAEINRSALIRIPRNTTANGSNVRIELRCPDPSANPYLAFNAMLAAGLNGIKQNLEPPPPLNHVNVYDLSDEERAAMGIESLPGSLQEALDAFNQDEYLKANMGETLYNSFINARQAEWDAFRMSISDWEVKRYLETI
jgi:glutamine synthetase